MTSDTNRPRSLREIELEVLEEGREWTRQRLEQKLQEEADRQGGVFPLSHGKVRHRRKRQMTLRSVVGRVRLEVYHGQDPTDKHWGCPIRESWGLEAHQQMGPALEQKLAFTATLVGSYEAAAQETANWDCLVDDSVIHALVQRLGAKAEVQTQERLKQAPVESQPQRAASELTVNQCDRISYTGFGSTTGDIYLTNSLVVAATNGWGQFSGIFGSVTTNNTAYFTNDPGGHIPRGGRGQSLSHQRQ